MPRPRSVIPEMYWLKSEVQWCVDLPTRKRLGADRAAAEQRYRRLVAEWLARGEQPEHIQEGYLTVAEALAAYLEYTQARRISDDQKNRIRLACLAVVELYGPEPADQFTQLS